MVAIDLVDPERLGFLRAAFWRAVRLAVQGEQPSERRPSR
ncbi:hypothetical protein BH18ACT15_BH18ACT15_08900 [soil metagenome]